MRSGVPHNRLARLDAMSERVPDQRSGGDGVPTDPGEDRDGEAEDGAGAD